MFRFCLAISRYLNLTKEKALEEDLGLSNVLCEKLEIKGDLNFSLTFLPQVLLKAGKILDLWAL